MRPGRLQIALTALALTACAPESAMAAAPAPCPGRPIVADQVITGEFGEEQEGSYVMVPFDVPAGTTAVRVKYCHDQPESPTSGTPGVSLRHTLDLGLYEPRPPGSAVWGVPEFRGWGGSSHPDVTVSAEGFSSEQQYTATPRVEVPGKTTRAFLPGPIRPGQWAVELGVAAVSTEGDLDGKVAWRVEIELPEDPAFADEPYEPAAYDSSPARDRPGWYAGDLHVHGEHSAYGDATMREVFDFAFRPLAQGGAGLDFVMLSDYVSGSAWGEIGRHQPRYPGRLVGRSAEVITYRGHLNNHVTAQQVDYRTGPLLLRHADGSLTRLRDPRPASAILAAVRRAGGFTQINHPTIFPSQVPGFAAFCRGCPWDYSSAETDYRLVDGIEVATGPSGLKTDPRTGPNPFTVTAIDFWERALAAGHRIAAIGVSDSHNAGRTENPVTQAPIGEATTVVHAPELSEEGVRCGVQARHTYVKVTGNGGPDVRFEATPEGGRGTAIMGDAVKARAAGFTARVLRGDGRQLLVVKDGLPIRVLPVAGDDASFRFADQGPGRYRLQLQLGTTIETVTSPIWLEPGDGRVESHPCAAAAGRGHGGGGGGERRRAVPSEGEGDGGRPRATRAAATTGSGGELPFTGFDLLPLLATGGLLSAAGLLVRAAVRTG